MRTRLRAGDIVIFYDGYIDMAQIAHSLDDKQFDLCRYLTREEPRVVSAVTSHAIHKLEIEDYAHVTLRTPRGVVFLNEASYTFPGNGSDQERKISGEKAFLRATPASASCATPRCWWPQARSRGCEDVLSMGIVPLYVILSRSEGSLVLETEILRCGSG
jgi:hypothetical protein